MPHSLSRNQIRYLLHFFFITFLIDAGALATPPPKSGKDEWPQWLGPNRDGISAVTGLRKSWPESGAKVVWRQKLGEGYSGISISQGRLFTLFSQGDEEFIVCLDAASGKEIWRVRSDSTYKDTNGNGPRSTPTIHNDRVYALGGRGKLYALRAKDGHKIWLRDLMVEFKSPGPSDTGGGGYGTSPLIEKELLLVEAGGPGHAFIAFDKNNGQVKWQAESDSAAFSSPVAITVNGIRQIVFFSGDGVVSLAPKDGRVYWRQPWKTSYNVNAATPLFIPPDRIFISSGYEVGATLLKIKIQGSAITIEEIWKRKDIQNIFSTSIRRGDYLYGFDKGTLKCIAFASGEEKWKQRGFGHGSLLLADGHLIILGDKGRLALVEATPEAYREKTGAQIMEGRCITVPALAGGKLFMRNTQEIVCVDLVE